MDKWTKKDILKEIQNWANEHAGKTPSEKVIREELEIPRSVWISYWTKPTDMQREAELIPNEFDNSRYEKDGLCILFISLMRENKKWPTRAELDFKHRQDYNFPDSDTFYKRLGKVLTGELPLTILKYVKDKQAYKDVVNICNSVLGELNNRKNSTEDSVGNNKHGFVYMFKSGRYYKIGMSKDTVRRGAELRIQLPEKCTLIHSIKTDDPSGIESYWHKRFEAKRLNGEWFDLSPAEVRAFKCWRRIA